MGDKGSYLRSNALMVELLVMLVAILFYSLPWLASVRAIGFSGVPPIFAPDGYTYLALSSAFSPGDGFHINPWYGGPIANTFGYRTFPLPFNLFWSLLKVTGGNWEIATFSWNLLWIGMIAALTVRLLRRLVVENNAIILISASFFFLFFSCDALPVEFSLWAHALRGRAVENLSLPFIRLFYPQIPAVLLLAFLYFLLHPRLRESWIPWFSITIVQFLAIASFPYATLLMAFICLIFCGLSLMVLRALPWRKVVATAALCAVVDLAYLYIMRSGPTPKVSTTPALHLELSNLSVLAGGTTILLIVLSLIYLSMDIRIDRHIVIASLGLANVVLLCMDAFLNVELKVSHHAGYFVQISIGLLVIAILHELTKRYRPTIKVAAFGLLGVVAAVNGVVAARAAGQNSLPLNQNNAKYAAALRTLPIGSQALVVLPADTVDSPSVFAPLITPANILFTRNAELLMSPDQKQGVQSERQALYLYLIGMDSSSVSSILSSNREGAQKQLANLDEQSYLGSRKTRGKELEVIGLRLLPKLKLLESGKLNDWLEPYKEFLILDEVSSPRFSQDRIQKLFSVDSTQVQGGIKIQYCRMK